MPRITDCLILLAQTIAFLGYMAVFAFLGSILGGL